MIATSYYIIYGTKATAASSTVSSITGCCRISAHTVYGKHDYVYGVILIAQYHQQRCHWCQAHRAWPKLRWRRDMFSNESRFLLRYLDDILFCTCALRKVRHHDRYGGSSVISPHPAHFIIVIQNKQRRMLVYYSLFFFTTFIHMSHLYHWHNIK